MEFNMTEKDKRLLVFLAAFLIIVGFMVFLILPSITKGQDLDARILEESATKENMQTVIASHDSLQIQYDGLKERSQTALDTYYPIMSSQEIDRKITGIVVKKETEAVDLAITMNDTSGLDLQPYFASLLALTGVAAGDTTAEATTTTVDVTDTSSADAAAASDNGEDTQSNSTLTSAKVVLTTQGPEKQLLSILNTLFMKRPEIHVNSYTLTQPSANSETEDSSSPVLTVDMNLYMCDKESVE